MRAVLHSTEPPMERGDEGEILLSTYWILLHDRSAVLDDIRQVTLVNFKFEPMRLCEIVWRDLNLGADMAKAVGCLK